MTEVTPCVSGIAISVAPYFVVLEVPVPGTAPDEAVEGLENLVIDSLATR